MQPSISLKAPPAPPVEPTPDERRNGWTPEALGAYIREQNRQSADLIFGKPDDGKPRRPLKVVNVKAFNPHRW